MCVYRVPFRVYDFISHILYFVHSVAFRGIGGEKILHLVCSCYQLLLEHQYYNFQHKFFLQNSYIVTTTCTRFVEGIGEEESNMRRFYKCVRVHVLCIIMYAHMIVQNYISTSKIWLAVVQRKSREKSVGYYWKLDAPVSFTLFWERMCHAQKVIPCCIRCNAIQTLFGYFAHIHIKHVYALICKR